MITKVLFSCQEIKLNMGGPKRIDVRIHFTRDIINERKIEVEKVSSSDNATDAFVNTLLAHKLGSCLKVVKVCSLLELNHHNFQ